MVLYSAPWGRESHDAVTVEGITYKELQDDYLPGIRKGRLAEIPSGERSILLQVRSGITAFSINAIFCWQKYGDGSGGAHFRKQTQPEGIGRKA